MALEDGFPIPPMSEEDRLKFSTQDELKNAYEKKRLVIENVKVAYEDWQRYRQTRQRLATSLTGAHFGHGRDAGSDPFPSAVVATCSQQVSNGNVDWLPEDINRITEMIAELLSAPQQSSLANGQILQLRVPEDTAAREQVAEPTPGSQQPEENHVSVGAPVSNLLQLPGLSSAENGTMPELLLRVVNLQQRQIQELERENERLKSASGWKCPFCAPQ